MGDVKNEFDIRCRISAEKLKKVVEPPVKITADGITNFHWREDGLEVSAVDGSNAMVVEQNVLPSAFEEYDVSPTNGDTIVFGTRCTTISNLLRASNPNDSVSLQLERGANRMSISFGEVSYELSGVIPEGVNEPTVPELDHDIVATVHSQVLNRSYQVIGMISESITFDVGHRCFRVRGKDDNDMAEITVELKQDESKIGEENQTCSAFLCSVDNEAQSRFSSKFIDYVNELIPKGDLQMKISEDFPMEISVDRAEGDIPTDIIIAPRMDS